MDFTNVKVRVNVEQLKKRSFGYQGYIHIKVIKSGFFKWN